MFDALSSRLQDVFRSLRGEARLTETTVDAALREIRLALLEADVNFRVVKAFVDRVREKAVDQEVLRSLTPDQHVVRIVRDEMLALFGDAPGGLAPASASPRAILLLGLQGSGKTTTAAKLGVWLTGSPRPTCEAGGDPQLGVVGKQAGRVDPAGERTVRARACGTARRRGFDTSS
jgi:signal recognition particle subunit SRP54